MSRLQNKPNISVSGLRVVDAEIRIWDDAFIKVYENKREVGKIDCLENREKRRTIGEAFNTKIQTDAILVRGHGRGVLNRMLSSRHRTVNRKIHLNNKLIGSLHPVYGLRSAWFAKNLPVHNRVKKWETLFYDNSTKEVQIYNNQNLIAVFRLVANGKYSFYVSSLKNIGMAFTLFVATLDSAEVTPEVLVMSKKAEINKVEKKNASKNNIKESHEQEIKQLQKLEVKNPEKTTHTKTYKFINKNADTTKIQLNKAERIKPFLDELNSSYKRAISSLVSLGKIKYKLLDKFEKFAADLGKVENLPGTLPLNNPYSIENLPVQNFVNEITSFKEIFKDKDSLFEFIGLNGFTSNLNNENSLSICDLGKEFYEIDVNLIDNYKTTIVGIRKLIDLYCQIIKYSATYLTKLKICLARYGNVLVRLNNIFKKSFDYKKIRKLVDSIYYSTILILDLTNTQLLVGDKINTQELNTKMKRRMI